MLDIFNHLSNYLLLSTRLERMDAVIEEGDTSAIAAVTGEGAKDALAVLLERRVGVEARSAGPQVSPLHTAAWYGNPTLAKRLRAAGASWNAVDK